MFNQGKSIAVSPRSSKPYIHISEAGQEFQEETRKRIKGEIKAVSTGFTSLDDSWMNGLERELVYSIGGASGAGKTAFLISMLKNVVKYDTTAVVYVNSYEMRAKKLFARLVASEKGMTMRQLMASSAGDNIDEKKLEKIMGSLDWIMKCHIYFDEYPRTAREFRENLKGFVGDMEKAGLINENMIIISATDHILIHKKDKYQYQDQALIEDVMATQNELKKEIMNLTQINLLQLNRDFDQHENVEKPERHYPRKHHIYGSDKIWHYSDIVSILDNPRARGIAGTYGPDSKMTFVKKNDIIIPITYFHNLKVRDSEPNTIVPLAFEGRYYRFSDLSDVEPVVHNRPVSDFKPSNEQLQDKDFFDFS